MTRDPLIAWLEEWYIAQCDGEWEHAYGITIERPRSLSRGLALVREALGG